MGPHMTNEKEFNTAKKCISRFEGNMKAVTNIVRDSDTTVTMGQLSKPLPITKIEQGDSSGIKDALYKTYRTKKSFRSFWKKHTSDVFPPPPLPKVDFGSSMVLAAFRGTVGSGGYSIRITKVEDTASEIVVRCITTDPAKGVIPAQVLSQPFYIASIASSNKRVRFVVKAAPEKKKPFPVMTHFLESDANAHGVMRRIE
mmetsp:Transcript_49405/g.59852  ORF Transcript_49405/g.59852 Transcript_49405/m.59852 type:complete len:200 (+) Transcript_49405:57-656(+)